MVLAPPAVMPSGIQPGGRSIREGNFDFAATGLATATAISTARTRIKGRRVIDDLPSTLSAATISVAAVTRTAARRGHDQGTPDRRRRISVVSRLPAVRYPRRA